MTAADRRTRSRGGSLWVSVESLGIEDQPDESGVQDQHGYVAERSEGKMLIDAESPEHGPGDHHADNAGDSRNQPCGKEGPLDIDEWITARQWNQQDDDECHANHACEHRSIDHVPSVEHPDFR